MDKRIGTY